MFDTAPNAQQPILAITLAQLPHEDTSKLEDLTDHEQIHIFMHRLHPKDGITRDKNISCSA